MKLMFAALAAILISMPATAQSYKDYKPIDAKPGQSCTGFNNGCARWCSTNRSDSMSCNDACKKQMTVCMAEGRWPLNQQKEVVVGLSP